MPQDRAHLFPLIEQDFSSPDLVPATSAAFLKLAVLLHWGWHYCQNNHKLVLKQRDVPTTSCVLNALFASGSSFATLQSCRVLARSRWSLEVREKEEQLQEQQQHHEQHGQPKQQQQQQQAQSSQEVRVQEPSGLFFPVPVYLQVLDDVLLLVCRLLTLFQPIAAEAQQSEQAASSSSSASASSGSSPSQAASSSCSAQELTSLLLTLTPIGKLMHCCLQGLLVSCTTLASRHMTEYAGMQSLPRSFYASFICCPEVPVLREDAPIWFQHAAQMCQVLEAYVRAIARSQAVGPAEVVCPLLTGASQLSDTVVALIDPTEQGLRGPLLQAAAAAGPGSKEQQQLYGLLRSVMKWAGNMGPEQQVVAEQLRAAVAVAAATMMLAASRGYGRQEAGDATAGETAAAETAAECDTASSSAAAASSSHLQGDSAEQPAEHRASAQAVAPPAATQSVLPHLPWLGVLGCCCLQWSQQLGCLPTDNPATAAAAAHSQLPHRAKGVISLLPEGVCSVWGTAVQPVDKGRPLIWLCAEAVDTWLEAVSDLPEPLLQPLESLDVKVVISTVRGCFREFINVRNSMQQQPDAPVPLSGYVQQLSMLGEALCAVAHKQSCNNPTCSNLSGPSELQLVKVRSSTCSGCRTARYCGPECMRQHWKQHRPVCKALANTAAAVASTEAA